MAVELDEDEDTRRRFGPEFWLMGLLVLVVVVQTIWLLTFTSDLRQTQDALVCQTEIGKQLRTAAEIERAGQRKLLTTENENHDPNVAQNAIETYLTTLSDADKTRADVPQCPPVSPSALAAYQALLVTQDATEVDPVSLRQPLPQLR